MLLRSLDSVLDWLLNLNQSLVQFVLLPVVASVLLFLCYVSIWEAVLCAVADAVLYLGSWRDTARLNLGSIFAIWFSVWSNFDFIGLTRPQCGSS